MNNAFKMLVGVPLMLGLGFVVAGLSSAQPMRKKAIFGAAQPAGPYSPAIDVGNMVFLAGQIGVDPAAGEMVPGGIEAETHQVMANARVLLMNAGLGFEDVVKTTVFLADINDFQVMNGVYASYFEGAIAPARSTVAVSGLARGARVEIDFIAVR